MSIFIFKRGQSPSGDCPLQLQFLWLLVFLLVLFPSPCQAGKVLSFQGHFDLTDKKCDVTIDFPDGGSVVSKISPALGNNFYLTTKLVHLKTLAFDLSTELESTVTKSSFFSGQGFELAGTFKTQYSLINYKPTYELAGQFELKSGQLLFQNLSWGGLSLAGSVNLRTPHEISLLIKLHEVMLEDFLALLGYQQEKSQITGIISGNIKLSGPMDRLMIKSNLRAQKGFIETIEYDLFNLNFEGVYPVVQINDSDILKRDGVGFNLKGEFDLSKGQSGIEQGLLDLERSPLVNNDDSQREWTIKRKQEEDKKAITELKYRLIPRDQDKATSKEADMLGVEQSIKF